MDMWTDRWIGRWTDRQTGRLTDRWLVGRECLFIFPSVYLPVHIPVKWSVRPTHLFVNLLIYLSLHQPIHLSVSLSVRLANHLSVRWFTHSSVHPATHSSVCRITTVSVHPSTHTSHLSIHYSGRDEWILLDNVFVQISTYQRYMYCKV